MAGGTRDLAWSVMVSALHSSTHEIASQASGARDLAQCSDCNNGKEYESADSALEHWHKFHLSQMCSRLPKKGRPFDDPCFVWICQTKKTKTTDKIWEAHRSTIVNSVELFLEELQDVYDQTQELHKLVTSNTERDDSNDSRPHLPSSLVKSFEGLLSMYILKAKELSWRNRIAGIANDSYSRHGERRLSSVMNLGKMTLNQVQEHLRGARRDIIMLGTTKGDMERVVIAPIGPEFLAAYLITCTQNNIAIRGTGKTLDLINHYRSYTSKLRFNTNRRPNRRAFLEISALEEELEALRTIIASQQSLLKAYQKVLSPLSFKSPPTDWIYYKERKASFRLENKCIRRQQRRLVERDKALFVLLNKARALRDETKQKLEILDEGHGKAIRVFTIVTLFFLPL